MGFEGFDFRAPDYRPIFDTRIRMLDFINRASEEEIALLRVSYRQRGAEGLADKFPKIVAFGQRIS